MGIEPQVEVNDGCLEELLDHHIPDLSIHLVKNEMDTEIGWEWTYRCVESDAYFPTYEMALVDFIKEQADLIDKHIGIGAEDDE